MKRAFFTLIELLIVLIIIMTMTGLVVSNFVSPPAGIRKKLAISEVKNAFADAKLNALASGTTVTLTVTENELKFSANNTSTEYAAIIQKAKSETLDLEEEEEETEPSSNNSEMTYDLPSGASFSLPEELIDQTWTTEEDTILTEFLFYPSGESFGSEVILNIGNKNYRITTVSLTSSINIEELEDDLD